MTPTLNLDTLVLERGAHKPRNGDAAFCVMEAVAYVAGEPWTDHPECASPIISTLLRTWNDDLPDADRQILKPLIPRLAGTRTSAEDEETRAWMVTDWLVRECAPAWLRLAGLTKEAGLLEQLVPVTSAEAAQAAQPQIDAAASSSDAAWNAARGAARGAAWDAAWDATRAAARDAAWDATTWNAARNAAWNAARNAAWNATWNAARNAAWNAARNAAWDAAWNAAEKKLAPTVKGLQQSALLLVERMIEVGRDEVAA